MSAKEELMRPADPFDDHNLSSSDQSQKEGREERERGRGRAALLKMPHVAVSQSDRIWGSGACVFVATSGRTKRGVEAICVIDGTPVDARRRGARGANHDPAEAVPLPFLRCCGPSLVRSSQHHDCLHVLACGWFSVFSRALFRKRLA